MLGMVLTSYALPSVHTLILSENPGWLQQLILLQVVVVVALSLSLPLSHSRVEVEVPLPFCAKWPKCNASPPGQTDLLACLS